MAESHVAEAVHAEHPEHEPFGWKKYVLIGVILTIITAVEVAIFYIDAMAPVLVPVLLVLSAGKFFLVVMYYMHLKMDHPIFGRVFWLPLALAVLVVVGMVILFQVLPKYGVHS
ncbi:MAG: cytochrome C oxidase subunit IV family protein [Gemmatimonadota bacterium]